MKQKFRLTHIKGLSDEDTIRTEFRMNTLCENIYEKVIENISKEVTKKVSKIIIPKIIEDTKFIKEVNKVVMNKVKKTLKPNKELQEIADELKKLPKKNKYGNLQIKQIKNEDLVI